MSKLFEDFFDEIEIDEVADNTEKDDVYSHTMKISLDCDLYDTVNSCLRKTEKYDYNIDETKLYIQNALKLYRRVLSIQNLLSMFDNYQIKTTQVQFLVSKYVDPYIAIDSPSDDCYEYIKELIYSINKDRKYNDAYKYVHFEITIDFTPPAKYTYEKFCIDMKKLHNAFVIINRKSSYKIELYKVDNNTPVEIRFHGNYYPNHIDINKAYELFNTVPDNNSDIYSNHSKVYRHTRRHDIRMLYKIEKYANYICPEYKYEFRGFTSNTYVDQIFNYYVIAISPKENFEYAYQRPSIDKFIKKNIFDRLSDDDIENLGIRHAPDKLIYIRAMVIISDEQLFNRAGAEDPLFREKKIYKVKKVFEVIEQTLQFEIIYLTEDYEVIGDYYFDKDPKALDYYGLHQRALKLKNDFLNG